MSTTNIPEEVNAVAEVYRTNNEGVVDGTVKYSEDVFAKTLPEDIDMDTVQKVNKLVDLNLSAQALVTGELAVNAMKKDKQLKQVTSSVPYHNNTISATVQRERQVPNADGGTSTAYGTIRASVQVNGAANKGSYKKVKSAVSAMMREACAE